MKRPHFPDYLAAAGKNGRSLYIADLALWLQSEANAGRSVVLSPAESFDVAHFINLSRKALA